MEPHAEPPARETDAIRSALSDFADSLAQQLRSRGVAEGLEALASDQAESVWERLGVVMSATAHAYSGEHATAVVVLLAQDNSAAIERAAEEFGLSPRERAVAVRIARAQRNEDIAGELGISPHTVRHHVERILAKLGARSRQEAAHRLAKAAHARGRRPGTDVPRPPITT